jgi:lysyl-tRNA synthetase class 2
MVSRRGNLRRRHCRLSRHSEAWQAKRRGDPVSISRPVERCVGTAERITVAEAFAQYADIELARSLESDGSPRRDALAQTATKAGIKIAADDTWSDIFSRVLTERVEPRLGLGAPTILDRYPRVEAALARACADDPRFAERFELYVCGVELANGFGELTDADEQRARFEAEMAEKQRIHGERYPLDEDFLAALRLMPEASGLRSVSTGL